MKTPILLAAAIAGVLAVRSAPIREGPAGPPDRPASVSTVDQALARQDAATAVRVWNEAYRAALRDGRWEELTQVADAYRRIGEVMGSQETFDGRAREIYRRALSRARRQASLDGVLTVAEALAALGDREGVEQSIRVAERLAGPDPERAAEVRAFSARVTALRVADQ
jgi:hypothetical protein